MVGWSISGTVGGLVLVVCLVGWFVGELCVSVRLSVHWSVSQFGWLDSWSFDGFVWLDGELFGGCAGSFVGCLVGRLLPSCPGRFKWGKETYYPLTEGRMDHRASLVHLERRKNLSLLGLENDRSDGWLVDCLFVWWVGGCVGGLIGWLVGWLVGGWVLWWIGWFV